MLMLMPSCTMQTVGPGLHIPGGASSSAPHTCGGLPHAQSRPPSTLGAPAAATRELLAPSRCLDSSRPLQQRQLLWAAQLVRRAVQGGAPQVEPLARQGQRGGQGRQVSEGLLLLKTRVWDVVAGLPQRGSVSSFSLRGPPLHHAQKLGPVQGPKPDRTASGKGVGVQPSATPPPPRHLRSVASSPITTRRSRARETATLMRLALARKPMEPPLLERTHRTG